MSSSRQRPHRVIALWHVGHIEWPLQQNRTGGNSESRQIGHSRICTNASRETDERGYSGDRGPGDGPQVGHTACLKRKK
jgi:hypothetical protein